MKKLLGILVLGLLLSSNAHADKIKKNGFLIPTNKWEDKIKIDETFKVNNPKDKIIIIHNHGSSYADVKVKDCFWVSQLRNFSQLAGDKINEKEIMVYVHCQNHLEGDLGAKLSKTKYWTKKWEGPYPGTTKIDRRVAGNLEIVKKFIDIGVPKKQIIMTGHSCGGWTTLMLTAKHMQEVGGGIALMPACNWTLSKRFKVKKVGLEKALEKFHKKHPGIAQLRDEHIKIMKEGNAPILIFTHPMDHFEGLTSDWMDEVPNFKRIVISNDKKINGKKCKVSGKDWTEPVRDGHSMDLADCFLFYHSTIKEYIASRIK